MSSDQLFWLHSK